jgi:hypothetical protein
MYVLALGDYNLGLKMYFMKGRHIILFETKEEAQLELDTYYYNTDLQIIEIKVIVSDLEKE